MFLGYSLKRKALRCFYYRTKIIVECTNVRIDEKVGTKERIMECNSNEELETTNRRNELLHKANNDLQYNVQNKIMREEQRIVLEIRIEVVAPTPNKNLIRNHPANQIIGSKEKGVMKRSRINEELCLIYQVEPKSANETIKDDHWIKEMEEEL